MDTITNTLIRKNFEFRSFKVKQDVFGITDSLAYILCCIFKHKKNPVWMSSQTESYLSNYIHSSKDKVKLLSKDGSSSSSFELVEELLLLQLYSEKYGKFKDIAWINDFAENNNNRAIARISELLDSNFKNVRFEALIIKSFLEGKDVNIEHLANEMEIEFPIEIQQPLSISYIYYLTENSDLDINIFSKSVRQTISLLSSVERDDEYHGIHDVIEDFMSSDCGKEVFLRVVLLHCSLFSGSTGSLKDGFVTTNTYDKASVKFICDFFTIFGINFSYPKFKVPALDEIKRRALNSSLIIIRPHMLAGKSNLFDIEYLKACIESICTFEKERAVVFIVNEPSFFSGFKQKNLFILSFDDVISDDFLTFTRSYKHFSTNHLEFEQFSISSYFLIKNLLKKLDFPQCHIIEGDTLLLRRIEEFDAQYPEQYLSNMNTCCFAKVSFSLLELYCETALKMYQDPEILNVLEQQYKNRLNKNLNGGFNDMTIWKIIADEQFGVKNSFSWGRCDIATNLSICDHYFEFVDEKYLLSRNLPSDLIIKNFQLQLNDKQLDFQGKKILVEKDKNNSKFFYISHGGENVRVNTIQFGGKYKSVMVEIWNVIKQLEDGQNYV